nr:transposase [Rickettsia endosymbiont of Ceutorhynchus assimilis]
MMTQRTYDKEFKINAVKLYLTNKDKKSINSLAKDLGIATSCLSHWIRNYRDHEEKSFVGSGNSINQEMRELKRKLYLVRQERDILKKAVAIFSAPQGKGTNL